MRIGGWLLLVAFGATACGGKAQPVPLDWTLHSTVADEELVVQEGVRICAYGHSDIPCATTDKLGKADLALPSGRDLLVSYEKAGFVTKLREVSTKGAEGHGLGGWLFQRRTWYEDFVGTIQGTLDLQTKGAVSVETHHAGADVQFKLRRLDGPHVDFIGPAYVCIYNYSPHMVFCNQGGTGEDDRGLAVFMNVEPGEYAIDIDTSGSSKGSNIVCTQPGFRCDTAQTNCVTAHVVAGKLTHASGITCQ